MHFMQIQCAGQVETPFNISLSNHRWDISDPNTIPAYHHFPNRNRNVNTYALTAVMATTTNRNELMEVIQDILRKR